GLLRGALSKREHDRLLLSGRAASCDARQRCVILSARRPPGEHFFNNSSRPDGRGRAALRLVRRATLEQRHAADQPDLHRAAERVLPYLAITLASQHIINSCRSEERIVM